MRQVSVREARKDISQLLDAVEAGEEIVISRRGTPVARLTGLERAGSENVSFPSRRELRARLPQAQTSAARLVRELRDERG